MQGIGRAKADGHSKPMGQSKHILDSGYANWPEVGQPDEATFFFVHETDPALDSQPVEQA